MRGEKLTIAAWMVVALLAACALRGPEESGRNSAAIKDAYLIAHGMVESYASEPNADPAVARQLGLLDERAAAAIHELATSEGSSTEDSASAVAALSNYAAEQTTLPR